MVDAVIDAVNGGAEFGFALYDGKGELVAAAILGQGSHVEIDSDCAGFVDMLLCEDLVVLHGVYDIAGGHIIEARQDWYIVLCGKLCEVVSGAKF